ncbi:MAG: sel1 repeat family protein [Selenomonadaceae bacterium]|nr:sel1 repeat family protein [Selenomonadaceae bacterium]
MEIRENSKLALTMKWALTHYAPETGWTIDGKYASEQDVVNLISMAYKQFDMEVVKKAIAYFRENWTVNISKETRHGMNKKIMDYEVALADNKDTAEFTSGYAFENAPFYCLLGELYDNKGDVQYANYWYQKSALLGFPEGEGKLGLSYHRGYGMTADDLNDDDIEMAIHMRSDKQALFWLQKAQNDGWEEASRYIDQVKDAMAEQKKKENRTLDEMIKDAAQGIGLEQIELADAYENGDDAKGIPIYHEEAVYWYDKSLYGVIVHEYSTCLLIADILENKICDKKRALKYYRKAYLMDNVIVPDDERQKLLDKINAMTNELFPDRQEKVAALSDMLNADQLSDGDIKALAEIMEYLQESVYEERTEGKEKDKLLRRIPKAKSIINAAFEGRGVGENALGIFYQIGVILPMNFDKAEYWYLCAYTDGYDTAYENLTALLFNRGKKDEWTNFVILAARDGIEDAKKKCDDIGLNCMKTGPVETKMLDYYAPEKLIYKDATEEQIELLEQFILINNERRKRGILFQLVPSTTNEYVNAFLSGEPYSSDAVIDKLMDTDDWQTRKKIISDAGIDVSDEILRSVPYMPLSKEEQRGIFLHGYTEHKRSPYRNYAFSERWSKLTEKEKTVIRVMDADHRLTFDIANIIVNDYEKKLADDEQTKQPSVGEKTTIDEEHIFWLDYGNNSRYMKRQAYAALKLNDEKITEETLRQAGANRLLNLINMEINPILHPLVSWAATLHYERMVERFKAEQET